MMEGPKHIARGTIRIYFFDEKGIVHFELIKQRQTMNQLDMLTKLRDAVRKSAPQTLAEQMTAST